MKNEVYTDLEEKAMKAKPDPDFSWLEGRCFRVTQMQMQPKTVEDIQKMLATNSIIECDPLYQPTWGGAVYQVKGKLAKVIAYNWDSSD